MLKKCVDFYLATNVYFLASFTLDISITLFHSVTCKLWNHLGSLYFFCLWQLDISWLHFLLYDHADPISNTESISQLHLQLFFLPHLLEGYLAFHFNKDTPNLYVILFPENCWEKVTNINIPQHANWGETRWSFGMWLFAVIRGNFDRAHG